MSERLSEKAMLVRLSISQWTAKKYDKKATKEVLDNHSASADAGRFNKALVAQSAVKVISKIANEARTFHYANTLPWQDDGSRILPAANFSQYSGEMRKLRGKFEAIVSDFIDSYPSLVADARYNLNGLFNEADYPDQSKIASKYGFEVDIMPMPEAADFRVDLADEELFRIRADIGAKVQSATDKAMTDLWDRLYQAVSHMSAKLGEPDAIFRNSLVENLVELCDLLPRLNVTGDRALETMRQKVESSLCQHHPDTLRDSAAARQETAKSADDILSAMAGFIG